LDSAHYHNYSGNNGSDEEDAGVDQEKFLSTDSLIFITQKLQEYIANQAETKS